MNAPARIPRPALAALALLAALAHAGVFSEGYFRFHAGLANADDVQLLATLQRQVPYDLPRLLSDWPFRWTAILLYAGDLSIGRLHPAAFHAASLAIHAGSAALVALVGAELGLSLLGALAAGALFGAAALHHETLRWLLGRFDLLAAAFSLASALLYLRWTRAPERRALYGCSLAAAALAAGSKESAVVLGPLMLWLGWTRRGRGRGGGGLPALRASLPFLGLAAAVLAAGILWTGFSNSASLAFGGDAARRAVLEVFPRFLGGAYREGGTLGVSTLAGGALVLAACAARGDAARGALAAAGALAGTLATIHAAVASSALPNHFYFPAAWLALLAAFGADRLAGLEPWGRAAALGLLGAIVLENLILLVL